MCMYVHVFVNMCARIHVLMYGCACGGQWSAFSVFLPYFFETVSLKLEFLVAG